MIIPGVSPQEFPGRPSAYLMNTQDEVEGAAPTAEDRESSYKAASSRDINMQASIENLVTNVSTTDLLDVNGEGPDFGWLEGTGKDPELVIGLVGAMGTDLNAVSEALEASLDRFNYKSINIKVSEEFSAHPDFGPYPTDKPLDKRYKLLMERGTDFRRRVHREGLAWLAIAAIRRERMARTGSALKPVERCAYLLRSLKHPDEVGALRRTYGRRFILVAAYTPRDQRVRELAAAIASSRHRAQPSDQRGRAERLVLRDELERDPTRKQPLKDGQQVGDVFPLADAFVDARDRQRLVRTVDRTIEILFAAGFHTPSRDEQGVYFAQSAALRSSSLARQVGAALATEQGDILATGVNEVPKAGGGEHWEGDEPDGRDFTLGRDVSDEYRKQLAADALQLLQEAGWLRGKFSKVPVTELVTQAFAEVADQVPGPFGQARIMDVLEYVRAVHAEMSAITTAARSGISTSDMTLYVTTFPCHECARLIVAAGIRRVVYIEPYPKSLAAQLYPTAIQVEGDGPSPGKVGFEPFIGIAPRRYSDWFIARDKRKIKGSGVVKQFSRSEAQPRIPGPYSLHPIAETFEVAKLEKALHELSLRTRASVQ